MFKYFELILTVLSSMEFLTNPDILEELMPWNESVRTDSFHGISSSRISGLVRNSMLERTVRISSKYLNTSSLFAFAVSTMLYISALAFVPFGVSLNSRFFLPTVNGLIAFSAAFSEEL